MTLPNGATFGAGPSNTPTLILKTAHSTATIALHGATVLSFVPTGQRDLLWVSPKANAAAGKAVRGGIPLCGPWFGPHLTNSAAPMHGLMRTRLWTLLRVELLADKRLRAEFQLELPPQRELGWHHSAAATFTLHVGESLQIELSIRNTGTTPFLLSGALHSYFAVSDVRNIKVEGLADREFIDYTAGGIRGRHDHSPVKLNEEMARFFLTDAPVCLVDAGWNRVLNLRGWGHGATIVWNPWDKTAATMPDLGDAWPGFVCIEHANVPDTAVALRPSMTHHLGAEVQGEAK